MYPYLLLLLFATAMLPQCASAQRVENHLAAGRPDFSGKWRYNYEASGPADSRSPLLASAIKMFLTIEQDPSGITIATSSEPAVPELPALAMTIYTDGRSFDHFPGMRKRGFSATVDFEGGKLVTRIFNKSQKLVDRSEFELLVDGKRLRIYHWHGENPGAEFEEYSVYDRVRQ